MQNSTSRWDSILWTKGHFRKIRKPTGAGWEIFSKWCHMWFWMAGFSHFYLSPTRNISRKEKNGQNLWPLLWNKICPARRRNVYDGGHLVLRYLATLFSLKLEISRRKLKFVCGLFCSPAKPRADWENKRTALKLLANTRKKLLNVSIELKKLMKTSSAYEYTYTSVVLFGQKK